MSSTATTFPGNRLSLVVSRLAARTGDFAAKFAKLLFDEVDIEEIEPYGIDDLVSLAADTFLSFRMREPGAPKITVKESRVGGYEFLIVDIVNDDMPFLLDSVLGEFRDLGLVPELVAHPIFEVRRDRSGALQEFVAAGAQSNGGPCESFIHLQIRKAGTLPPVTVLEQAIGRVLAQVKAVVTDYQPMMARINLAISEFEKTPPPASKEINAESIEFLRWLVADNFTFLGIREYGYAGDRETGQLLPRPELGLGLLRDMGITILRRGSEEHRLTAESRSFFLNSPPVIVAKANSISPVHRRVHMDTVGIKLYGDRGAIKGEVRVGGLFTASAYNLSTRNIPLLRLKVDSVIRASSHPPNSFSGRALMNVLETFPRDELFQISGKQLARITEEILKIDLTPRARVFVRRDEFGRFVSVFVYVPRERFNTDVRVAIGEMLEAVFDGRFDSFTPFFPESPTVRIHYVIWRRDGDLAHPAESDLEHRVEKIIRTWSDDVRDLILKRYGDTGYKLIDKYGHAFPAGYQETNSPSRAVEDLARLEKLGPARKTDIDLHEPDPANPSMLCATLQQLDEPLPLSRRVPILENFGFDVVSEQTFELTPKMNAEARRIYLHELELCAPREAAEELSARRAILEEGFLAVWNGAATNDRFNGLILGAGLDWQQAALLRAYSSYLRQSGSPYGFVYVAEVLNKHPLIAKDLVALFATLFDPENGLDAQARERAGEQLAASIGAKLDAIPALDEDRILRSFLALVRATLRTNFYQQSAEGAFAPIALKLRSKEIGWLPDPKPFAEIYVYSPQFEAIHLRAGPIARGGLRWSDRPQDFRTEILSLAKAQQVKNVVIVPKGAKGGFVPRRLAKADRYVTQAEGVGCYKSFVTSLLSITDNVVKGEIVAPARTVRRDSDDPYLVVAADKGTATFSDLANDIALKRSFWLGDAFASGGSAGYDHKKMGITARGAWEAVKRHFREMDIDIQTTPFTVAGVGDMSGDVFGNGMLLSKAIKLVAAFDHRDIFIDPDPDPATSYEERKRLFDLPRSSWADYDKSKLSAGGGVYSRASKFITLSRAAQKLLGLKELAAPNEVISAILKAQVDLLWFGGIGTYVRSSSESDADAGDKANDAVRITARELRAKVIGEGANLGVTQRGRIEFALLGGRINTDAIDNSAGVNTSDVEVNIKIALGSAVSAGRLDTAARNELLAAMTDDVAQSVLRNNYLQTLAISIAEREGLEDFGFQQQLMQKLEKRGLLDRKLEKLPSDAAILERMEAQQPLTRPELAVLLAYAKIDLEDDLIHSSVPDDPYLGRALFAYFPPLMRERFAAEIETHRLRREIIATSLTNDIINSGGPTFIIRLIEETGHTASDIAYAFAAVMAVYDLQKIYGGIDVLDGKIPGQPQLRLYRKVQELLRSQTAWFLRNGLSEDSLEPEIARYRGGVEQLAANLTDLLPEQAQARLREEARRLEESGIPPLLSMQMATFGPLCQALDIVSVANATGAPVLLAAKTLFAIRAAFRLDELEAASQPLAEGDYFNRLAVNSSLATVASAQRTLAKRVITESAVPQDFLAWRAGNEASAARVSKALEDILSGRALTLAKLTVGVAQFRDLAAA